MKKWILAFACGLAGLGMAAEQGAPAPSLTPPVVAGARALQKADLFNIETPVINPVTEHPVINPVTEHPVINPVTEHTSSVSIPASSPTPDKPRANKRKRHPRPQPETEKTPESVPKH